MEISNISWKFSDRIILCVFFEISEIISTYLQCINTGFLLIFMETCFLGRNVFRIPKETFIGTRDYG